MKNVILLHGALGAESQFDELEKFLKERYTVHRINFSGHGREAIPEVPFSINLFSNDVIKYLDAHAINTIDIFGYSMGGYVGVYLARNCPERVGRVFILGTQFIWNKKVADQEVETLNARTIQKKFPLFYEVLEKRHTPGNVETILEKIAEMMKYLGQNNELNDGDNQAIQNEFTICVGDRDRMVSINESTDVFKKLPYGRLLVFPNTRHQFEQVNMNRIEFEINNFFGE